MEGIRDITQKISDDYLVPAVASTFVVIIFLAYKFDGSNLRKNLLTFLKKMVCEKEDIKSDAENSKLLSESNISLNVPSTVISLSPVKIYVLNECSEGCPLKIFNATCCDELGNVVEFQDSNLPVATYENSILLPSKNYESFYSSDILNMKKGLCDSEDSEEPLERNISSKKITEELEKVFQIRESDLSLVTNDGSMFLPSRKFYDTNKYDFLCTNFNLNILHEKDPLWDYYEVFYPSEVPVVTTSEDFNSNRLTCGENCNAFYSSDVQAVTSDDFNPKSLTCEQNCNDFYPADVQEVTKGDEVSPKSLSCEQNCNDFYPTDVQEVAKVDDFNPKNVTCEQNCNDFFLAGVQEVTKGDDFKPKKFACEQNCNVFYPSDGQVVAKSDDYNPEKFTSDQNRDFYVNIYGESEFKTENGEDAFKWDSVEDTKWSEKLKLTRFTDYLQIVY